MSVKRSTANALAILLNGVPLWIRQTALLVVIYAGVMLALMYWMPGWRELDLRVLENIMARQQPDLSDDVSLVYVRSWDGVDVAANRRTLAAFLDGLVKSNHPAAVALDFDFGPCSSNPCGEPMASSTARLITSLRRARDDAKIRIYAVDLLKIDEQNGRITGPIEAEDPAIYDALSGSAHTDFFGADTRASVPFVYYRVCYNAGEGGLPHDEWGMSFRLLHPDPAECPPDQRPLRLGPPLGASYPGIHSITSAHAFPAGANFAGKYVIVGWEGDKPEHLDRPGPELVAWSVADAAQQQTLRLNAQGSTLRIWVPLFSALTALAFAAWFLLLKRLHLRALRPFLPDISAALALIVGAALFAGFEYAVGLQPQITLISCGIVVSAVLCDVRGRQILFQERWNVTTAAETKCDYDVFISYAHEEQPWVRENVLRPLQDARLADGRKLSIFYDESTIRVGDAWKDVFCDAIDASKFVIPIYSETYKSKPYCVFELSRAHEKWVQAGPASRCVLPIMRGHPAIMPTVRDFQYRSVDDEPNLVQEIIALIVSTLSPGSPKTT